MIRLVYHRYLNPRRRIFKLSCRFVSLEKVSPLPRAMVNERMRILASLMKEVWHRATLSRYIPIDGRLTTR